MGVEAKLQPSNPPKPLSNRTVFVQLNALNTVVIPHDLKDVDANAWAFATNDPPSQPQRRQRVGDNEVVCFVDGKETLPQFQWEIEQTNGKDDFIYLLGWYLDIDFPFPDFSSPDGAKQQGKPMRQLLTEAGKRKVQIRVMLDGCPHNPIVNGEAINFVLYGLDAADTKILLRLEKEVRARHPGGFVANAGDHLIGRGFAFFLELHEDLGG